jgi:predicted RNA-binding protein associated with RNAse of E/G family
VLRIAPRGAPFEVFAPLAEGGGVQWWYVNFERPLQRTTLGFDTFDETLDLVVQPDCSSWVRKDQDELELALSMGFYTAAEARRIDETCRVVEAALARGVIPWDTTWADWRPGAR